jgi:stage II sporulation protein D
MRRLTFIAIVAVAAVLAVGASSAPTAPTAPTAFILSGGGWGHGVGMSQWGAFGQAKAGRDYAAILAHYYSGTSLGEAPTALIERVRVLVGNGLGAVAITNVLAVFDGAGKRYPVPDGTVTLRRDLRLPVATDGSPVTLEGPVTIRAKPGTFLTYGGKAYRGDLRVAKRGKELQLVNVVGLEAYLLGVVPGEMPKHWPLEALKAQAVAARTYAVAHIVNGKGFDLYSDWRSQVYYGVGAEAPGPSQAVRETRGKILTFEGQVAQTFYFSSSGGRTISALDAFGSDVPYLVAVDDPWDVVSPNHAWAAKLLSGAQVAKRFGLRDAVTDAAFVPGTPGKPAVLRLTSVAGTTTEVRLSEVRARLGLKSTGFQFGVLRLDQPTVLAEGTVRLSGVARAVASPVIQQRNAAGAWVTVKRLAPAPDGAFAVKVKQTATTVYRLAAGDLGGPPLTVRIAA